MFCSAACQEMIDNQKQSGKRRGRGGRGGGLKVAFLEGGVVEEISFLEEEDVEEVTSAEEEEPTIGRIPTTPDDMKPRYVNKNGGGTIFGPQAIVVLKPSPKQKTTYSPGQDCP